MHGFLREFREFAVRGNMVDMAVGIIIGAAFTSVVQSFVNDILMPPISLLVGGESAFQELFIVLKAGTTPGPYPTPEAAKEAGAVTLNLGMFLKAILSFTIVAFATFLLVRTVNRMRRDEAPPPPPPPPSTTKCPFCVTDIPIGALRCPHCTSELARA
ncbi:MAG: large conductance mechanosensitive channel protein MscL [Gemmatimonadetes bacterium]|nr:large conductance mechanosensitive channel protein MscL [Gemmatimonadota bacterium]